MKLELDPSDLRENFQKTTEDGVDQNVPTSVIRFDHLNEKARKAVMAVGKATFYTWEKDSYQVIHAPK